MSCISWQVKWFVISQEVTRGGQETTLELLKTVTVSGIATTGGALKN
jgi:hypothetical protein